MATLTFDGVGIGRACELRARQDLCAHHFILRPNTLPVPLVGLRWTQKVVQ